MIDKFSKDDSVPYDESDTCWHLLVTTNGHQISIIKNLDAPTARQAYRKILPQSYPVKYINAKGLLYWMANMMEQGPVGLSSHTVSVQILGPEGVELDPWKGVEPKIIDMGPEKIRQDEEKKKDKEENEIFRKRAHQVHVIPGLNGFLSRGFSRCACCSSMQLENSLMFWVPDRLTRKDSVATFKEVLEKESESGNGSSSAWCVNCVPKDVWIPICPPPTQTFKGTVDLPQKAIGRKIRSFYWDSLKAYFRRKGL